MDDVELPPWAVRIYALILYVNSVTRLFNQYLFPQGTAEEFVRINAQALESDYVTQVSTQ